MNCREAELGIGRRKHRRVGGIRGDTRKIVVSGDRRDISADHKITVTKLGADALSSGWAEARDGGGGHVQQSGK